MKIMLMTDLEGVAGVVDFQSCHPEGGPRYWQARRLLTQEANAAAAAFFDAGFAEVLVVDGHGPGGIDPELVDERVTLSRGCYHPLWPWGLDRGVNALAFVGQHAMAGTPMSHLTHTGDHGVIELSVNGVAIGEYGQLALCAGELGIPVIFASGEAALLAEVEFLTPGTEWVAVKQGLLPDDGFAEATAEEYAAAKLSAEHLAPPRARLRIAEGAAKAAKRFMREPSGFRHRPFSAPWHLVRRRRRSVKNDTAAEEVHAEHDTSFIAALNQLYHQERIQGALT